MCGHEKETGTILLEQRGVCMHVTSTRCRRGTIGRVRDTNVRRLQAVSGLPAARDVLVLTARKRLVAAAACGELVRAAWKPSVEVVLFLAASTGAGSCSPACVGPGNGIRGRNLGCHDSRLSLQRETSTTVHTHACWQPAACWVLQCPSFIRCHYTGIACLLVGTQTFRLRDCI